MGTNLNTKMAGNKIGSRNMYGYALTHDAFIGTPSGSIGQQGANMLPSDNHWVIENDVSNSYPLNWTLTPTGLSNPVGHYKTACFGGSNAANSVLYVQNIAGSDFDPNDSHILSLLGNRNSTQYDKTGNRPSIYYTSPSVLFPCQYDVCNNSYFSGCTNTFRVVNGITVGQDLENFIDHSEAIAQGTSIDESVPNYTQAIYVARQQLYNELITNDSLVQLSAVLQDFMQQNSNSALNTMYQIDTTIASGDLFTAFMLLNNFNPTNNVESNYVQFTNLVLQTVNGMDFLQADTLSLLALANLCPVTEGAFIHNARNMYNWLTQSINSFPDNCDDGQNEMGRMKKNTMVKNLTSQYSETATVNQEILKTSIYPNPSIDGKIHVEFSKKEGYNQLQITDLYGRIIQTTNLLNGINSLNIKLKTIKETLFLSLINTQTGVREINKIILQ